MLWLVWLSWLSIILCALEGHQFDSQLGHMPNWAQEAADRSMFLSLPSSFSQKKKKEKKRNQ